MKHMTSHELRGSLAALGVTQAQLAADIGVSPRTMRTWVAGTATVSQPAAILIRLMTMGKLSRAACNLVGEGGEL